MRANSVLEPGPVAIKDINAAFKEESKMSYK
jgi:hypothetical protein